MPVLADFTITIKDARKWMGVQVVVHETVQELRMAAQMHYNTWEKREDEPGIDHILGVCHRFHMANSPVYAVVRLAPPDIGAGMVAHELCHATVWLWEIQNKFDGTALEATNDEWFCWVLGELVSKTTDKLYETGVY